MVVGCAKKMIIYILRMGRSQGPFCSLSTHLDHYFDLFAQQYVYLYKFILLLHRKRVALTHSFVVVAGVVVL